MPIYEYRCDGCGHALEALQRMSDAPLTLCPACGKEQLSKQISAASFRLKGGGWYETDFKTGKKKQLADSDSGSPAKGTTAGKDSPTKAAS
ncbi:MAG: zinc ribbon domain-containing protein [Gammaproteobacteria bacterium]|jgi:putative FmdB family regulatory protein|nr:zinc ribbon domain-containing protein [Gammaproteobacteria bacterium]